MKEHEQAEDVSEQVRTQVHEIESLFEGLDEQVQKLVAEKPLLVLGGTLIAGFLAGRILARR